MSKRPRTEPDRFDASASAAASHSADHYRTFDLGDYGSVTALVRDPSGKPKVGRVFIGSHLDLPNSLWAGWTTGTSPCRVEGYIASFNHGKRTAPAWVVRTLEDSHCYPFGVATLSKAAKEGDEIARRERLASGLAGGTSSAAPALQWDDHPPEAASLSAAVTLAPSKRSAHEVEVDADVVDEDALNAADAATFASAVGDSDSEEVYEGAPVDSLLT